MLFACVYVCTFQPGNVTGQGSEGVNKEDIKQDYDPENNAFTYLMSKFVYIYSKCYVLKLFLNMRALKYVRIERIYSF